MLIFDWITLKFDVNSHVSSGAIMMTANFTI